MTRARTLRLSLLAAALAAALAAPPAGASGVSPVGEPPEAALGAGPGEGVAIPLRGAVPPWYTDELHRRVQEEGVVDAPTKAPLPGTVGIRPGSWMISPSGCTMNFVFRKSSAYAIGTAGHCVNWVGQDVTLLTVAPGGSNPVLVNVGSVLIREDNGIGNDFALVSVRPELTSWVDPTIALIGGPCGAHEGASWQVVAHYGHGVGIGAGGTPRAGLATVWRRNAYGWAGTALHGDSGSPVRVSGGAAAGNLTHLILDLEWLPAEIAGTRIGKIQKIATGWTLLSGALC